MTRDVLVLGALVNAPQWLRERAIPVAREPAAQAIERSTLRASVAVVIIDDEHDDPLALALRARRVDDCVQVIVAARQARVSMLEHRLLFIGGSGDVWIVSATALDPATVERAAAVTARRREFRGTLEAVRRDLSALDAERRGRTIVSSAFLATLLQVLPDPVMSVDRTGAVLSWNVAAARLLGRSEEEAAGKALAPLIAPGDPAPVEDALARGAVRSASAEIRFVRAGGERGIAEITVSPVEDSGGDVRVVLLHDVTELRRSQAQLEEQASELEEQTTELAQLNEALQEQARALESALASRNKFYAAMSHELRTPINAILGYDQLLLEGIYGPLAPDQRRTLERARRAASHLQELVSDVLDLARIEAGRVDIEPEWVRLPSLVEELFDTVRPLATESRTPLALAPAPADLPRAYTDPRRVRQILLNLLSNAIKYGEGNPVCVELAATEDGGVCVDVIDHGSGISAPDLERIFREFVRLNPQIAGTGLGLAISRALARALGGRLEARSAPGEGSTFRLVLPPSPRSGVGDESRAALRAVSGARPPSE